MVKRSWRKIRSGTITHDTTDFVYRLNRTAFCCPVLVFLIALHPEEGVVANHFFLHDLPCSGTREGEVFDTVIV